MDKKDIFLTVLNTILIFALITLIFNQPTTPPQVDTFEPPANTIIQSDRVWRPNNVTDVNLISIDSFADDIAGAASLYASYDYSVLGPSGEKTIRLDADPYPVGGTGHEGTREVTSIYPVIAPGDHIVYTVWCKTSSGITNTAYTGGRAYLDLQVQLDAETRSTCHGRPTDYTVIDGVLCSGNILPFHYTGTVPEATLGNPAVSTFKVPFNTAEWTQIGWDFYVPNTYYLTDIFGNAYGASFQIAGCGPGIDAREQSTGTVWFADPEFYINPTVSEGTVNAVVGASILAMMQK